MEPFSFNFLVQAGSHLDAPAIHDLWPSLAHILASENNLRALDRVLQIEGYAMVHRTGGDKWRPLHYACHAGAADTFIWLMEIVPELLESGDINGDTPLEMLQSSSTLSQAQSEPLAHRLRAMSAAVKANQALQEMESCILVAPARFSASSAS